MRTYCLTAKSMKCSACKENKDCWLACCPVSGISSCEFAPKSQSDKVTVESLLQGFKQIKFCGNLFLNDNLLASFHKGKCQVSRCFSNAALRECYVSNVRTSLVSDGIAVTWDLTTFYD